MHGGSGVYSRAQKNTGVDTRSENYQAPAKTQERPQTTFDIKDMSSYYMDVPKGWKVLHVLGAIRNVQVCDCYHITNGVRTIIRHKLKDIEPTLDEIV